MTSQVTGIAASSGIAFGNAYILMDPDLTYSKDEIDNHQTEIEKFHTAIEKTKYEIDTIRKKVATEQGEENAAIFDAHLLVLSDPELITNVENNIKEMNMNAAWALDETANQFVQLFEQLDNEYMRERAADIKDVSKRILAHLLGKTLPNPGLIEEKTIVIAEDLTPSDTAQINKQFVKGFITNIGGRTSHSAIMARSMEIPAIVGTKVATKTIKQGDYIIVDGMNGEVIINPSNEEKIKYERLNEQYQSQRKQWALLKDEPTITNDKHQVQLMANIGSPNEMEVVLENGAEGIGLYRTEFLYMESTSFPTEEEQFEAYKTVLKKMDGRPVVVRTLDIGGDKHLPYWNLPEEANPFLGLRAVRLALKEPNVFRTQLRALLRASVFGNLHIMFPMIATIEEFLKAKQMLHDEMDKLRAENIAFSNEIKVGIMVEIPATALLANQFAKEVDFFSIGTNDLIQYTFAADRMNESVSYLYQPYHPAILRLIKMIIDAAHQEGKLVGMCGEMAGDPIAAPLLLGLGLDEFSMSPSSILQIRSLMKKLSKIEMEQVVAKALTFQTAEEVENYVENIVK